MKLYLYGHEYKYAVEQMLLTMLPGERPEYPEGEMEGDGLKIALRSGAEYTTALCSFYRDGALYRGRAAVKNSALDGAVLTDRHCQRIVKSAVYRTFLAAGMPRPAWGALTGVRPGKILCQLLRGGMSERAALRQFITEYDVSPGRAELCMDTTRVTLDIERELGGDAVCLYVGIPFCPTRCAYCSFVSQAVDKSMKLIPEFLDALYKELDAAARQINTLGLHVISIYMGGGTPTTLTAPQLDGLCGHIEDRFDLSFLREYTVEAGRPDTITPEKLAALRAHGVDRVSVNPQTMSDAVLEAIGRRHSAADIVTALETVRAAGGFAVNMDLIAGLPQDSVAGFEATVDEVLALAPENITVHTLSLKKGSAITLGKSAIPGAAEVGEMLELARRRLLAAGYRPYYLYRQKYMSGGFENVGWTRSGHVNIYNVCIMEELCSIIACGGGGSTKLIRPGEGRNIRFIAPKYPKEYIDLIDAVCAEKAKISEFYSDSGRNENGIRS